jgi:hypothetical protein
MENLKQILFIDSECTVLLEYNNGYEITIDTKGKKLITIAGADIEKWTKEFTDRMNKVEI